VAEGLAALRRGDPVLIHDADDRENETDLVYPAQAIAPADVARLRKNAGGLICVALPDQIAAAFDLPFLSQEINHPAAGGTEPAYDDRSSFSVPVNHIDTHTGVTDNDRALTITKLAEAASAPDSIEFAEQFRCPGHVFLLRGASGGLITRQGHTELSLALANAGNLAPATVVCEMLDDTTGEALPEAKVQEYAAKEGLPLLEGKDVIAKFC